VDIDPPTIRMHILVTIRRLPVATEKFYGAASSRRLISRNARYVLTSGNDTETAGAFEINARGEMQIAILVEQMRTPKATK